MSKKFAVISSTGASVVKTVYAKTNRSEFDLDLIIVDRECGAKEFALNSNIDLVTIGSDDKELISDAILSALLENEIDYVYVFYTRLLKGGILKEYSERIINFHPSLLPACPGLHGFEDTLNSGAMLVGSTAHFLDSGIDTGKIILQTFASVHGTKPSYLRHVIFSQQCASLYAIHKRLANDMPLMDFGSRANDLAQGFLPNLDADSLSLYQIILNKA